MEVGFKTDRGLRRSNNEDACYVLKRDKVFIVADGVGGNNSGEVASKTCVDEIAKYVEGHDLHRLQSEDEIQAYFENCIRDVNFKVLELAQCHEENRGMATTVVAAHLHKGTLYIVNIGDSRAYIMRNGALTQITEDHTYVNSLVKAGLISEEEAEHHENRNMITRAVGADYRVEADFFVVPVIAGDRILICTDGLYGEVNVEDMTSIMKKNETMTNICEELLETAKTRGGNDNITMVVVEVTEDDINE